MKIDNSLSLMKCPICSFDILYINNENQIMCEHCKSVINLDTINFNLEGENEMNKSTIEMDVLGTNIQNAVYVISNKQIEREKFETWKTTQTPKEDEILIYKDTKYLFKDDEYINLNEVPEHVILWAKDYEDVIIPSKKEEDADYDIYAYFKEDYIVIQPHETRMIPTGLRVAMNKKWKLALEERGSTGTKGMGQRAGEVDSGFRGEIKVPITNHNNKPLIILKSEASPILNELAIVYPYSKAICQGAIVEVPKVKSREINVELLKAIPSERGEKMLGSSGK